MTRYLHTRYLEEALSARGLIPDGCTLVEVSLTPNAAVVVRYEVLITADQLEAFAEAMQVAAMAAGAQDARPQSGADTDR